MARRLTPKKIAANRAVLRSIELLGNYQSVNPAYSLEALLQLEATLQAAEESSKRERLILEQSRQSYGQARQIEGDTALMLNEALHIAKAQVLVQYGEDSYAVKSVGWVRKSDRKRPARKAE